MELFFSPNGRIDQPAYWRAVLVLGGISVLLWLLSAYVNAFFFMLGIFFWWPWIAVHVKRFHDAGKTGWITVAMIVAAIVLYYVFAAVFGMVFGSDLETMQEIDRQMTEAQERQDVEAMLEALDMMMAEIMPVMIFVIVALTAALGGIMSLFKTDPNDNQYGPGPGGSASADLFA